MMPLDSPYINFYLSSIVTVSLSCTGSEILSLISKNLKKLRDHYHARPFEGKFVIPMLNRRLEKQWTKFEVCSFSHSGDIVEEVRT